MAAVAPGDTAAAAAAAGDSRELVVPPPRPGVLHMCVEYPGYVGDEQRVLETLGGTAGIARQLQENPRQLALRLRPGDHNFHATYGMREPSRRLLLKLTRPAPDDNSGAGAGSSSSSGGSSGGWTAEVVATLPHTYRFSTPADYQYVAHDSRPVEEQSLEQLAGMTPPLFQPQPLLCAPPLFAKQPQFDYAFRGHMAAAGSGGGTTAGAPASAAKKKASGIMASFFDLEVPQPLPEAQMGSSARAHPDILRLLRQLLQQRPVWPAAALHEAVAAAGGTARSGTGGRYPVDDLLPKLCYKFRNGPWKNAWTRRGYDPRIVHTARQWQCIEYHLPSEWYQRIAEHKKAEKEREASVQPGSRSQSPAGAAAGAAAGQAGELPPLASSYSQLVRFEAVPSTQNSSLQLGLLADSVVQQLLADPASHGQHCSDTSGWLTSAAHDAIKKRIKGRFTALLEGTPIEDAGAAELAGDAAAAAAAAGAPQQQQRAPQQQQRAQQQQQQQAMEVDGSPATGQAGAAPMQVDALAQQAQQLRIHQQAAAAAAGAGGGQQRQEEEVVPGGLMASLHDYLAHLPEGKTAEAAEEEEEEEEEDEEEEEEDEEEEDEEDEEEAARQPKALDARQLASQAPLEAGSSPSTAPAAAAAGCPCFDAAPPGGSAADCTRLRDAGSCHSVWMVAADACALTCGRCTPCTCTCSDVPPDGQYTCAQQAAWGKCGEAWMLRLFCQQSCRRCACPFGSAATIPASALSAIAAGSDSSPAVTAAAEPAAATAAAATPPAADSAAASPTASPSPAANSSATSPPAASSESPQQQLVDPLFDALESFASANAAANDSGGGGEAGPGSCRTDVLNFLRSAPDLSLYLSLAVLTGWQHTYLANASLAATLLLPSDTAVRAFLQQQTLTPDNVYAMSDQLESLLAYHTLPTPLTYTELTQASTRRASLLTELPGAFLEAQPVNATALRLSGEYSSAALLRTNVALCRTVVHVLDAVLLPTRTIQEVMPFNVAIDKGSIASTFGGGSGGSALAGLAGSSGGSSGGGSASSGSTPASPAAAAAASLEAASQSSAQGAPTPVPAPAAPAAGAGQGACYRSIAAAIDASPQLTIDKAIAFLAGWDFSHPGLNVTLFLPSDSAQQMALASLMQAGDSADSQLLVSLARDSRLLHASLAYGIVASQGGLPVEALQQMSSHNLSSLFTNHSLSILAGGQGGSVQVQPEFGNATRILQSLTTCGGSVVHIVDGPLTARTPLVERWSGGQPSANLSEGYEGYSPEAAQAAVDATAEGLAAGSSNGSSTSSSSSGGSGGSIDSSGSSSSGSDSVVDTSPQIFSQVRDLVARFGWFSAAPQLDSVTFLLPTDTALEAFAARFNGSTLQAVLASPHALQALASYHVLEDRVTTGQLYEGQRLQTLARDAQGKPLPLTVHRGGPGDASITFRGAGSTAGLLVPDVPVCGGIIQVIDQVLLPVEVPAAAASSPDGAPPSSSGTAAAAAG
ncbi:General transcription factor 3C polypeptide 5 [Chlorella sorokiniana]|uniref:General transcription factor 3C polypeptide 5 n=1 Tax=Chlorella sorokiniana TaxID=3076 RepID=A0A2P6TFF4_CHLSO|nr:General transcription factor 3C polypeptide 5 [Chlorella sorokiniana]|eukprot:PRW32690.1 General transcription factor 3C polypeptide 5 [Chlorella sorokiniana]